MGMRCKLFIIPDATARRLTSEPEGIHDLLEMLDGSDAELDLDKSWHGLHFVLTGAAWADDEPLSFIARGGETVGDEDVGYGPARVLLGSDVRKLHAALANFTEADFARNFDLEKLTDEEIYPNIWDEDPDELKEEYSNSTFAKRQNQVKDC